MIEPRGSQEFEREISRKQSRKLKALSRENSILWFGLGMFGLVGWAVVLPTLCGVALGIWLDSRYPQGFSWTLTLLFVGLSVGCLNAWHWIQRKRKD